MPHRDEHLAWHRCQHLAGNVLFSGPTADRSMGIYVVRAASLEEARRLIDFDPMHAGGLRRYEVLEGDVHQDLGVGPFTSQGLGLLAQEHKAAP